MASVIRPHRSLETGFEIKAKNRRRLHHSQVPQDLPAIESRLDFVPRACEILTTFGHDAGRVSQVMQNVFKECQRLRFGIATESWLDCVRKIRESELLPLVHQDPFTRRAFEKPRGYAGDAVMMDLIYGCEEGWSTPSCSVLGNHVFDFTSNAAASLGVRARREYMACLLDEVAQKEDRPRVLAVASGHLREASMSSAVRRRRFGEFIAVDADRDSLQEVKRSYDLYGIKTQHSDIAKIMKGSIDLGQFSMIYSTGLYDYLNERLAQRLTLQLFSMLQRGGRLVLANFLPRIPDIGYMEACMDWFLVYRDRLDMVGLTGMIDPNEIGDMKICVEENRNIVFLEITKRGAFTPAS